MSLVAPKKNGFSGLMHYYGEIYRQICILLPDLDSEDDRFVSVVRDEPPVYLEILARHRYTTELRITHYLDSDGQVFDPDCLLRISHDAQVAEAVYCYPRELNVPLLGALGEVSDVAEYRYRCNRFVDRWLEYLLKLGHGLQTFVPVSAKDWPDVKATDPTQKGLGEIVDASGKLTLDMTASDT